MIHQRCLTETPAALELTRVGISPENQLAYCAPFRAVVMLVSVGALERRHVQPSYVPAIPSALVCASDFAHAALPVYLKVD